MRERISGCRLSRHSESGGRIVATVHGGVCAFALGDGAGFGQIGFGVGDLGDELGERNLDGDEALQLVIMGEVDKAEAAFAQHSLDPVATDLLRKYGC